MKMFWCVMIDKFIDIYGDKSYFSKSRITPPLVRVLRGSKVLVFVCKAAIIDILFEPASLRSLSGSDSSLAEALAQQCLCTVIPKTCSRSRGRTCSHVTG